MCIIQGQNIFLDIYISKIDNYIKFWGVMLEKPMVLTKHAHTSISRKNEASLGTTIPQKSKRTRKQQQEGNNTVT